MARGRRGHSRRIRRAGAARGVREGEAARNAVRVNLARAQLAHPDLPAGRRSAEGRRARTETSVPGRAERAPGRPPNPPPTEVRYERCCARWPTLGFELALRRPSAPGATVDRPRATGPSRWSSSTAPSRRREDVLAAVIPLLAHGHPGMETAPRGREETPDQTRPGGSEGGNWG